MRRPFGPSVSYAESSPCIGRFRGELPGTRCVSTANLDAKRCAKASSPRNLSSPPASFVTEYDSQRLYVAKHDSRVCMHTYDGSARKRWDCCRGSGEIVPRRPKFRILTALRSRKRLRHHLGLNAKPPTTDLVRYNANHVRSSRDLCPRGKSFPIVSQAFRRGLTCSLIAPMYSLQVLAAARFRPYGG